MEINDQNRNEWIEKYLEHRLSTKEKNFFEASLNKDKKLELELKEQQEIAKFLSSSLKEEKHRQEIKSFLANNPNILLGDSKDAGNANHFFLNNSSRLAAVILLLITSMLILYVLIPKKDPQVIVEGDQDTTQKSPDSLIQNPPDEQVTITPMDDSNTVAPNPEQPKKDNPTVSPNPRPIVANISKYTVKNRLGFSGTSPIRAVKHPVLLYQNPPISKLETSEGPYYLFKDFEDTLRFFGNIQMEEIQLLYIESDIQYLLVRGQDTLEIYPDVTWQSLKY